MTADERRDAILDRLADHVLAHGLATASLRPLARAAETSDRMLLYYFPDKAAVIAAVLERVTMRLTAVLAELPSEEPLPLAELRPRLVALFNGATLWPYMALWLEIAGLAARGDPLLRRIGGEIARGFLAWGAARLDHPERDSAALLVDIEGIVLLKSVGLEDVIAAAL